MHRETIETPLGDLRATIDEGGNLTELLLPNRVDGSRAVVRGSPAALRTFHDLRVQLTEYFTGIRTVFSVPLQLRGSPFEMRVWTRLAAIPYGATMSYGEIANELALKNGARAIGRANGANPIPIIVPCHRVIGTNGTLVGYGGGLQLKRALLEMERAPIVSQLSFHVR